MTKILSIALSLLLVSVTFGAIQPSEVLIIGNGQSTASLDLARKYAAARKIPSRNIIMLDLPLAEEITREQYNHRIAYPVRMFIQQQKLQDKIKVLVTMYGVPLKVKAAEPSRSQLLAAQQVRQKFYTIFQQMENEYRELEKLSGVTTTQPTTLPGRDNIDAFYKKLPIIAEQVASLMRRAVTLVEKQTDRVERQVLESKFVRIRLDLEGQMAVAMAMQNQKEKHQEYLTRFRAAQKEFSSLLVVPAEKRDVERTCVLAREIGGLYLELRTLFEDYCRLMHKESMSAVDSELSLVLWNDYALSGKIPNVLNPRFTGHYLVSGNDPVLMVSRLDGPGPDVVERIIRDSVETERKGLSGKFYLDARGIKKKDGYWAYDENIRQFAGEIKERNAMPVVLDNLGPVFAPQSCPDTALYCGWYSLKRYVPAFTFVPGSVGYHIASLEAITLRKPKSNIWVKRMLEDGITATLGAVEEPLLDSFPLPSEFFGLLMTGKYTLAEVFYRTSRYNSWRIILIGDPLYNPFAKRPLLDEKDVHLQPLSLLLFQ